MTARAAVKCCADERLQPRPAGDAEAVLRVGEPDPHVRSLSRDRAQAREVVRGDDRPPLEPEPPQLGRELVEARLELQIDVEADVGRLVGEERERIGQRRELRCELVELGERPRAHGARRAPVGHLVEVVGVRQDERAERQIEDVELDEVDALLDGRPEGPDRVLGLEVRRPAVADPQDGRAVLATQLDHAPLRFATPSHHQASAPRRSACATVNPAASVDTSSQKRSG